MRINIQGNAEDKDKSSLLFGIDSTSIIPHGQIKYQPCKDQDKPIGSTLIANPFQPHSPTAQRHTQYDSKIKPEALCITISYSYDH